MSGQGGGTGAGTGTGTGTGSATAGRAKLTLSVKDVKFDTQLTHDNAAVWFRRLRLAAETLSCDKAFYDDSASDEEKRQAKFLLAANLPDDETHLLDATPTPSAKDLYDKVTAEYAGTTYVRKAELLQKLINMRPNHEKLSEYLTRAIQLRAEMISAKCGDEELYSAMFLIALRDTDKLHDWSVQQLQVSPPAKVPELVTSIKTVHRNLLDTVFNSTDISAHTSTQGQCLYCKRSNHHILSCWKLREDQEQYDKRRASSGRGQSYGRGDKHGRGGRTGRGDRGGRGTSSHQVRAFIARVFNSKVFGKKNEILLDNCATDHMFTDRSWFTDYKSHNDRCHFADSEVSVPVVGKGNVEITNDLGDTVQLKNALHVPSFSSNLISVSKADANGGYFSGGGGHMQVTDGAGTVLVRGTLRRGLYHANCTVKQYAKACATASNNVSPTIIHRRFGHVGMSTLEKMARHQSVMNLPASKVFSEALKSRAVCGACQEGGQKATNFPRTPVSERTCVPYAKLHVDIAHMKTTSVGGSNWFTVLVDEATGFKWVFTHRTKDESSTFVMEKIETFIADGHRVKYIRRDRDTVFGSHKFSEFLRKHYISDTPTSGYSPPENGHAERAIGVLKQMVQSMLSDSGLSHAYWAEALWHACYLSNITSSSGSTTPWELLKHTKPDAASLRIWGCKAWKLIPREQRRRNSLLVRSEEVRFLGIAWPNPKAFRVLSSKGKIDVSRHVEFDESELPACERRADFSPFMETEITTSPQPVQSQTAPPSSSTVPDSSATALSPLPTIDDMQDATADQHEISTPTLAVNPLFESEPEEATMAAPAPTILSPTNIPSAPAPRRSERSNKNVPPDRYGKFVSGLPGAKCAAKRAVSFRV
jgi:transposase InsO family protein